MPLNFSEITWASRGEPGGNEVEVGVEERNKSFLKTRGSRTDILFFFQDAADMGTLKWKEGEIKRERKILGTEKTNRFQGASVRR